MTLRMLSTLIWLSVIVYVRGDAAAGPDPNPVADPGRKQAAPKPPVIAEQPTDIIAIRSKMARFYCRADGYPEPHITWLKDGVPLKPNQENSFLMPSGEIVFYRVRNHGDEGTYQCVAQNSLGEVRSRNATLRIAFIKEDFRLIPKDTVAALGEEAVLECGGPRGLPEPKISWKKNGVKIGTSDLRIKVVDGDLVISGARKSDSGSYQCVASNGAGSRSSVSVLLAVQEPPRFVVRPTDTTVLVGEEVELACEAQGDPKPRIKWTKMDGAIQTSRIVPLSNGNLRITKIQAEDEGKYLCNAENRLTEISAPAFITVQMKPEFIRFPKDLSARVGTTVTLYCSVAGKPKPDVLWHATSFAGNMFPKSSNKDGHMVVNADGDLTIYNVQFADEGEYTCQGFSAVGHITAKAKLTVLSRKSTINPPIIRQGPSNRTVVQGSTVELSCTTSAVPVPELQWTREGSAVLRSGNRFTVTTSGGLKISNIQNSDAGRYTCTATNDFGRSRWDAWIKVVAKGTVVTPPNDDITRVPSPPSAPTLVNVTSTTATVRWEPHAYAGESPVTGYILEYYCLQSESATWVRVNEEIPSSVYTVKDLAPSSSYIFIVRALNSLGTSNPSEASDSINTLGNIPSTSDETEMNDLRRKLEQISVRVTEASPLSPASSSVGIRLVWKSSANCDIIDGFTVYLQPVSVRNGELIKRFATCYARNIEMTNLRTRTIYEIRIRPYKGKADGHPSPIVLASPESEGTAPEAPSLKADTSVPQDDKLASATFTWTTPAGILPEYVKQYTLRCHDQNYAYDYTITLNGTVTTVTLDDLPRGRNYVASLVFSTLLGKGLSSEKQAFSIAAASAGEEGGISSLLTKPGVLVGIAVCGVVVIVAIIVGIFLYKKYKRGQKSRGLHGIGRGGGIPLDPFAKHPQYTKGFTMSLATGNQFNDGGGGNNNGESSTNNKMYLQRQEGMSAPPSVARNTTVSLTNRTPTQVMSTADLQHQLQQQQFHRRQSDHTATSPEDYQMQDTGRDLINMDTPIEAPAYHINNDMDLPPPPSPPMSQKTSLSDRTSRSRGSSKHSTDRSSCGKSRRSRERNRPPLCDRIPTDTDTGIDSPQQTPSPPRPTDLLLDHTSGPPAPPVRGGIGYSYPGPKPHYPRHAAGRRADGIALEYKPNTIDPSLGYLAGPSEGDTESELDGGRRIRTKNYASLPEEPRNSVTASSVSMMNAYGSESDCESSGLRTPDSSSSIESLNMESASQVGVNEPEKMMSPRSNHSAFVPIQAQAYDKFKGVSAPTRPGFVKHHKGVRHHQSAGANGQYPETQDYLSPPRNKILPPPPAHLLNRVNSASSSGSSSYHQNTADSGMSAGVGSYGHNSLNSSSSAESNSKGQIIRSRTTGSFSAENPATAHQEGSQNGHGQFSSVDRRYISNAEPADHARGRQPAPQPRRAPRMGTGGKSVSKSPQRKDSSLSLPVHETIVYDDYQMNLDDRKPMLPEDEYRTNEADNLPEPPDENQINFLAAKSVFGGGVGGKPRRGRHPELSDVAEASTSDFCEDYSDRSQ